MSTSVLGNCFRKLYNVIGCRDNSQMRTAKELWSSCISAPWKIIGNFNSVDDALEERNSFGETNVVVSIMASGAVTLMF